MYICENNYYKDFDMKEYDHKRNLDYMITHNWDYMITHGGSCLEGLEEVKKDLEAINTLIEADFDKISGKDFYSLISRFYLAEFTIKDLLNFTSRVTNVYYDKIELLNTRDTFETSESYGYGKDRDCKINKYQASYVVATASNFRLNPTYNYSPDEINSMKSNNQIVIFSIYPININNKKLPYKEMPVNMGGSREIANLGYIANIFKLYNFNNPGYFDSYYSSVGINFDYINKDNNDFSQKLSSEICSMIKMRFNKEQVLMFCEKIVSYLKNEYEILFTRIEKSYFYADSDKERYLNLAKEIVEMNDALAIKLEKINADENIIKAKRRSYL